MAEATTAPDSGHARRWWALAVLAVAQLMIVLDATVVNIALPERAEGAGILQRQPAVDRHRLLAGLRQPAAARRPARGPVRAQRHVLIGLIGFAGASAARRRAPRASRCWSSRARCRACSGAARPRRALAADHDVHRAQGARPRRSPSSARVAGGGGAIGLLLGGVLTEYLSWRWTLFVNLVIRCHRGRRRARAAPAPRARARAAPARHPRHRAGHGRAVRARLRLRPRRERTAGRRRRPSASWSSACCCWSRSSRSQTRATAPAAAAAGGARPQPRRRRSCARPRSAPGCSACSCS